uniref:PDZ domain-containing protein n=1 Tax=Anopheles christyi TaxID=43041 RepID=A0A182KEX9_9DIPT
MPEFVIEKRNIPVLTVSSRDGPVANENGDNPLGFRITGGADFEMPVTVFQPKVATEGDQQQQPELDSNGTKRDEAPDYYKRPKFKRNIIPFDTEDLSVRVIRERFLIPNQVSEGSPAQKAGLQLGDQILQINGADASAMRLATAQSVIKQAGEQLQMIVAKDDENNRKAEEQGQPKETHEVKFVGNEQQQQDTDVTNKPAPPLKNDERENWTQPPERKVWHPIVWQQPPPPIPPDLYGKDAPHQQLIANIRRLLTETRAKPEERQRHIERMMLSLPSGSRRDEDEDELPQPVPKPKPKRKKGKGKKAKVAPRTRLDSETSEDGSVSEQTGSAQPAEQPIPEEVIPCDSRRSSFDSTSSGHEHRSLSCDSCDSLSVLAVEQQLRQMQQQLNEISVIPMQIQATLSFLTQTLSKFAPPEVRRQLPEALRATTAQATEEMDGFVNGTDSPSWERAEDDGGEGETREEEAYAITLDTLFDESDVLETIPPRVEEDEDDYEDTFDGPEMSEEERSRIEKLERVIKLQKSWPWSQQEKPIHKRSNCHLVPSVALERSKIKQLTNMETLPFYKHSYLTRV